MGPIKAWSTCLRKSLVWSGRSGRAECWWCLALPVIVLFVLSFVSVLAGEYGNVVAVIFLIVEIVLFATNFAVAVRRLHDTGRTATLPVVSSALAIAATVLFFSPRFYATTEVGMSVIGPILMSGGMLVTIGLLIASAIVGLIAAVFLLLPGDPEPNRYGPPPGDHEDPGDKLPSDSTPGEAEGPS